MKNTVKLLCLGLFALLCGCRSPQIRPEIVPAVEVKTAPQHTLGIIGGVEPVYFLPMKTPFPARIDTGATNSSVDVSELHKFERDGEKFEYQALIGRNIISGRAIVDPSISNTLH